MSELHCNGAHGEGVLREEAPIVSNRRVTDRLYLLEVSAPAIAARVEPGQFVHAVIPGMPDHVLRRPFSVFKVEGDKLVILYQVVGFGTRHLTTCSPGEVMDIMGPVGRGWTLPAQPGRVLVVAGGVGAAPLFLYVKQLVDQGFEPTVVLGAQTAADLVTVDDYTALLGHEPLIATDDGSRGFHGFCTQPAAEELGKGDFVQVVSCGPEPVMRIVAGLAADAQVPCLVSMEKRMACGIGACLSCIVETVDGRKRSCVDGPVFDASKVVW